MSSFVTCPTCKQSIPAHRLAAHEFVCNLQSIDGTGSNSSSPTAVNGATAQLIDIDAHKGAVTAPIFAPIQGANPFSDDFVSRPARAAQSPKLPRENRSSLNVTSTKRTTARKDSGAKTIAYAYCPYCSDKVLATELGKHAKSCWANPQDTVEKFAESSPFQASVTTTTTTTTNVDSVNETSVLKNSGVGKITLSTEKEKKSKKNGSNNSHVESTSTSTTTTSKESKKLSKKKSKKRMIKKPKTPPESDDDEVDHSVLYTKLPDMKHDPNMPLTNTMKGDPQDYSKAPVNLQSISTTTAAATPPQGLSDLELAIWLSQHEEEPHHHQHTPAQKTSCSSSVPPVQRPQSPTYTAEMVACSMCKQAFGLAQVCFLDSCAHVYCSMCLRRYVMQCVAKHKVSQIQCQVPKCEGSVLDFEVKMLLTEGEFEKYGQASVMELVEKEGGRFITCVNEKCDNVIERAQAVAAQSTPAKLPAVSSARKRLGAMMRNSSSSATADGGGGKRETDADGKPLSDEALQHKNTHRFRCRECRTEFCAQCRATPYHLGSTCEQWKSFKIARHCRFCDAQIKKANKSKHACFAEVCKAAECVQKVKASCTRTLECKHWCGGIRNEKECLPCMREPCCRVMRDGVTQTGDEFCAICYVEDLNAAPAIRLRCGHIFHQLCVSRKVGAGWPSSRINFTFMECPVCKAFVHHDSLEKSLKPHYDLYEQIRQMAVERLRKMRQTKVKELVDPKSPYYKKMDVYAMQRFCYYPCFKCKKPYFGGEKACGAPVNAEEYDPKDLVCAGCTAGKQSCKKHGNRYIEYKCKFCCATACWFCWGNTHMCDACHKIAPKIARKPRSQLPKCTCGVPHPRNGEEYCLGCSYCRLEEKQKKEKVLNKQKDLVAKSSGVKAVESDSSDDD